MIVGWLLVVLVTAIIAVGLVALAMYLKTRKSTTGKEGKE